MNFFTINQLSNKLFLLWGNREMKFKLTRGGGESAPAAYRKFKILLRFPNIFGFFFFFKPCGVGEVTTVRV